MMLGHTSLEVTEMYMHLAQAHIQVQHRKFSPVDRLNLPPRRRSDAKTRRQNTQTSLR